LVNVVFCVINLFMQLPAYLVIPAFCFSIILSINKASHFLSTPQNLQDTLPSTLIDTRDTGSQLKIFEKVDVEADFPGGVNGWRQYLEQNLNADVPVVKGAPAGKYMVVVQFIVAKDGTVSDIKALTRYGYGMEQEVVRIIKKSPKWSPAQQNGRTVNAYRKQPITFVVQEEKKKRKLF
jgi:hypothetical protein